jgi:hypothetical protein
VVVTQIVPDLEANQFYTIREGAPTAIVSNIRSFQLPVDATASAKHPMHAKSSGISPATVAAAR